MNTHTRRVLVVTAAASLLWAVAAPLSGIGLTAGLVRR